MLQAIAFANGYANSPIASASYMLQCYMPVANPPGNPYTTPQTVTLSSSGIGTIRFTLDGSTPTDTYGFIYTDPIVINSNCTLKVMSYQNGWMDSSMLAAGFFFSCATPTFSPAPGTCTSGQSVIISSASPGATIRYTLDGSLPTETYGAIYTSAITLTADNTTINAIAYISGWTDSIVTSATYIMSD
jgi:hypothetical protein